VIKRSVILPIIFLATAAYSQEASTLQMSSNYEQQLENLTEQQEGETEDDSYLQALEQFK
jgi:hypothetical protein